MRSVQVGETKQVVAEVIGDGKLAEEGKADERLPDDPKSPEDKSVGE